ncbi:MAG: AHH domain-containing protein [Deltaproteobacteria bacterium]|nr:AHH domain-containing protein [Deltaproteobacteria bacterium]
MSKKKNRDRVEKSATQFPFPTYMTEKHHAVSVKLFSNYSDLTHNAKLIGYNVNDKENGICLPCFIADIVRHDLQCHRSHHPPAYNNRVSELLEELEQKSLTYCSKNKQVVLKQKLENIARRTMTNIENWVPGWYLRSNAQKEREDSYANANLPMP